MQKVVGVCVFWVCVCVLDWLKNKLERHALDGLEGSKYLCCELPCTGHMVRN